MQKQSNLIPQPQNTLQSVTGQYHFNLLQNENALSYLSKRGVSKEIIELFQIGLADNTIATTINNRTHDPEGTELLIKELTGLQILTKNDNQLSEIFNGFIVFPVYDKDDNIINLHGHRFLLKKGQQYRQSLCQQQGLYNGQYLWQMKPKDLFICDGIYNALSLWGADYQNVTALHSATINNSLHKFLSENPVEKIYIALSNTTISNKAKIKLQQDLSPFKTQILTINFPPGQGANQFILQSKTTDQSIDKLIRSAQTINQQAA